MIIVFKEVQLCRGILALLGSATLAYGIAAAKTFAISSPKMVRKPSE